MPKARYYPGSSRSGTSNHGNGASPWRGLLDTYTSPSYRPSKMRARYGPQISDKGSSSVDPVARYQEDVDNDKASSQHEPAAAMDTMPVSETVATIMCLASDDDAIGAALYDAVSHRLVLVEDIAAGPMSTRGGLTELAKPAHGGEECSTATEGLLQGPDNAYIQRALDDFAPSIVLLNEHCKRDVMYAINREAASFERKVLPRPGMEFDQRLLRGYMQELDIMGAIDERGNRAMTASTLATAALTALLAYLSKNRSMMTSHGPLTVSLVSYAQVMEIDKETQIALGIVDREGRLKAAAPQGKGCNTLFALLSEKLSTRAKHLLQSWLLRPSLSLDVIVDRQDAVACFLESSHTEEAKSLQQALRAASSMHRALNRLASDQTDASTWKHFASSAAAFREIRSILNNMGSADVSILAKAVDSIDDFTLKSVKEAIMYIIDFDESAVASRSCVHTGIDTDLDKWRETLEKLPEILQLATEGLITQYYAHFGSSLDIRVEYFPQLGYFIALRHHDGRTVEPNLLHFCDSIGWQHSWSSDTKVFFKSDQMHEMDTQLGDLHTLIVGREIEIIQQLRAEVLQHASLLASCVDVATELECLLRFADLAKRYRYIRPLLVEEPVLYVSEGRHPLQEHLVQTFVANDTQLGDRSSNGIKLESQSNVLIITGANACGKSVYMRQNALIVIMAQIGCFVPARRATIGIVDKMLACMPMTESMGTGEGSFHRDMTRLASVLQRSTSKSLIILDELGKGTAPSDGAAIFAATIRHLLKAGPDTPRVLAATHFHEVFHDDILPSSMPYSAAHMQVLMRQDDVDEAGDARLTFLYKLRPGLELASHASQCEKICGLPQPIIDRAAFVARMSRERKLAELENGIRQDMAAHCMLEEDDDETVIGTD